MIFSYCLKLYLCDATNR